jgi:hypothetical protein
VTARTSWGLVDATSPRWLGYNTFEAAAAASEAAPTLGQLNNSTRPDIEAVFADTISTWREALVPLGASGKVATFDNDFCAARGLEAYQVKEKKNPDISHMVPLLLN